MNSEYILNKIKLLQNVPVKDNFVLFDVTDADTLKSIFYGTDSNHNPVFVIESLIPQMNSQIQNTKKLFFSSNTKCEMIINGEKFEKTVHILTCLGTQLDEQLAFVRLTESFSKHFTSSNPQILNELFSALVNLFAQGGKFNIFELQGLFTELYVIKYFRDNGLNISSFWQKQNKLNFDFTINRKKRMEVKSTLQSNRTHHFKHEQLLSELYDIVIVSCLLRKDDAGLSLFDLINEVRVICASDYRSLLYIEQFIKNISDDKLHEMKYDQTYIEKNIRFFPGSSVPKFNETQPNGVTHTEYNSNLSMASQIPLSAVIEWFNDVEDETNV
ncbi:PD-(D/E)XK motif protein [Paenibacillus sp. FSL H7-0940]|uniref:PD-(D/E)XK motif protein n=1 Tax=Paenibacillus sp. FSL H7-0940 TaxID=2921443 RepID=UPI0030EDCC13